MGAFPSVEHTSVHSLIMKWLAPGQTNAGLEKAGILIERHADGDSFIVTAYDENGPAAIERARSLKRALWAANLAAVPGGRK